MRTCFRITFTILAAFVFLASPAWAGGKAEEELSIEPLSLTGATFAGPSGMGIIKLFESPPHLGAGVDLEMIVLPSPVDMASKVASGEVDFAVFPANVAAKLYTKGPGYMLGAVTGLGTFALLSRDTTITGWKSLEGKTVYATGMGATPDFLFRYFLDEYGVHAQADFSYNKAPQLAQMAIGNKVDSVILPEPFVSMVLSKAPDMRIAIDFQEEWKTLHDTDRIYPVTVVTVHPDLAENRPEVVRAFLDAYEESVAWVNQHPEEAGILIEEFGILAAAAAEAAIPKSNLTFIPAGEARESLESFLQVLLGYDPASVGGALPDAGFYFEK